MKPVYKYKNVTGQKIIVMNVGEVLPDQTITTEEPLNVEGLELVFDQDERKVGVDAKPTQPKRGN